VAASAHRCESLLRVAQPDHRDCVFGRTRGWRVPAPKIERIVAASAGQILSERMIAAGSRPRRESTSSDFCGRRRVERTTSVRGRSRSGSVCPSRSYRPERDRHPRVAQAADTRDGVAAGGGGQRADHRALLSNDNQAARCRDASGHQGQRRTRCVSRFGAPESRRPSPSMV
jgi:hypothetical protein